MENVNYSEYFFKSVISFINSANNLVYLSLISFDRSGYRISKDSFEFINNFKFLENLDLYYFEFLPTFTFKLKTLKKLGLNSCRNISFEKDSLLQLKRLRLSMNNDVYLPLNIPEL